MVVAFYDCLENLSIEEIVERYFLISSRKFLISSRKNPDSRISYKDINVTALLKDKERYIFIYYDEKRPEILRTLGRFASDPEFSFSWYDAAVLSQKIRQEGEKVEKLEEI